MTPCGEAGWPESEKPYEAPERCRVCGVPHYGDCKPEDVYQYQAALERELVEARWS